MEYGSCRACGRQIVFARTAATGKRMPLDPVSTEDGNVLVDGFGRAHVFRSALAARAFQDARPDDEIAHADQYMAHHATCPRRGAKEHIEAQEQLL